MPKFVDRVARLPQVVTFLASFPEGLPLHTLAARFDVDVATMVADLTTYLELESWGWGHDIFHKPVIEFVRADDEDDEDNDVENAPDGATVVRVLDQHSTGLGAEHLRAGDLAVLYTAGSALLDVDPDDSVLAEALGVIAETMYGAPVEPPQVGAWNAFLPLLQQAQADKRKVRIVYSRAWQPGVSDREIEPLRLVQTDRGWEVDAGPVGPEGNLRTYLLSNIRRAELLESTFEPPLIADALLRSQRKTTTVQIDLAQDARWAAELYAENVRVIVEDDATFRAELDLLPPVGERVALLTLAGGPDTLLREPKTLSSEVSDVLAALLRHHQAAPTI